MTTTLERPVHPWETHPGWGISVDLTPGEIVGARRLRVHKRLIGLGLVLVAVVCAGATLVTLEDKTTAESSYDAAQDRTAELRADAAKYDDITMMSTVTSQIAAQLTTLMAHDVDVVHLMSVIRTGLPPQLTVTNESILITPVAAPVAAAATPEGDGSESGDTPVAAPAAPVGPQVIGSVSLAGTGSVIKDLAPFVAMLNHLPGVVDVVPTSTTKTDTGMSFTLSMNITDELYTHAYDQVAR